MKTKNLILVLFSLFVLFLTACTGGGAGVTDPVNPDSVNCGRDIDCFIDASITCSPAIWKNQYGVDYQITGVEDGKCIMYLEFTESTCPYDQEELTEMLERWKNDEWRSDDMDVCDRLSLIVVEE